jgi:hypothetical protein
MPLSLNEIKDRALAFSHEWAGAKAERAEAQTFWNEFFNVFGISRRRVASFEEPVRRAHSQFEKKGGGGGFIDRSQSSVQREDDQGPRAARRLHQIAWKDVSVAVFGWRCGM